LPHPDVLEGARVIAAHETYPPVAFHAFEVHQVVIDVEFHHVSLDDQAELQGGAEIHVAVGGLKDFEIASVRLDLPELDRIARQEQALALTAALVEKDAVLSAGRRRRLYPAQRAFDHMGAAQVQFRVQHPHRRGITAPRRNEPGLHRLGFQLVIVLPPLEAQDTLAVNFDILKRCGVDRAATVKVIDQGAAGRVVEETGKVDVAARAKGIGVLLLGEERPFWLVADSDPALADEDVVLLADSVNSPELAADVALDGREGCPRDAILALGETKSTGAVGDLL